jgi:hypothetical protein
MGNGMPSEEPAQGTPMTEVAGPVIDALDESFLADQMYRTSLGAPATPSEAELMP